MDLPRRSFKLTHVRPFVRSSVTSFSRDWLNSFFLIFGTKVQNGNAQKMMKPDFKKKNWANLGQKLPENRVFGALSKIASLVFSDFWQKDRVQGIFPENFSSL